MTIRRRTLLGTSLLTVATASFFAVIGYNLLSFVEGAFRTVSNQTMPCIFALTELNSAALQLEVTVDKLDDIEAATPNESLETGAILPLEESIGVQVRKIESARKRYEDIVEEFFPDERENLEQITLASQRLIDKAGKFVSALDRHDHSEAIAQSSDLSVLRRDLGTVVDTALDQERDEFETRKEQVAATINAAFGWGLAGTLLALLASAGIAAMIAKTIARPLEKLTRASVSIAEGDLTARVPDIKESESRRDEVFALGYAFNTMAQRLESTTVSKEYLDRILSSVSEMLFITREDGRIVQTNRSAQNTLGFAADELEGRTLGFLQNASHEDAAPNSELAWNRSRKLAPENEIIIFTKHRRAIPVAISRSEMIQSTGRETLRFDIWVFRDCTMRIRYEGELRNAAEASEAANRTKSHFLAMMSHDLRTPLNGVIGMMELLLQTNLSPEQRRHASLAKSSGDMLLSLINDILDLSKIEAGRLELESTGFDLHNTVENVGECFSSRAADNGLELICAVHPAVPRLLQGDPGRLQQILTNLVGNAVKFTDKGEVVVRVTKDEETDHDVTVRFTVTDTGIGIPSEQIERLFQSYSQIDSSTTRKYGGTGLGLAICKHLIEAMGGEIGVTSTKGCGATFWFFIKLVKQAEHAVQTPSLPDDFRRVRVLAVDDNATNRGILHEHLVGWGLDHELTACGRDALSALRAAKRDGRPFGIAIVDQQMPEMDGEQLAREIKKDPELADTVLVLLTSGPKCAQPRSLMEIGFAGWLSKPAQPSHLLDTLMEAFVRSRTVSRRLPEELRASSPPPITEAQSVGGRILLAEDDEIGQEVAATILHRAGFQCDIVPNGKEVVEAVKSGQYDLVLMDCQMPELDGFQATQAVRSLERERVLSGGPNERIPIIALTANAIQGDRERCLAAGMDDYCSKPFDSARLLRLIYTYLGSSRKNPAEPDRPELVAGETHPDQEVLRSSPAFDTEKMLKQWGNDQSFVQQLIAKFSARAPDDLQKLREAMERNDADETQRLAHRLKGAAGYVAAENVRRLAAQLEVMAREGDLSNAESRLSELAAELQRCADETANGTDADETQTNSAHLKMGETP
jgi:PAS domain S-box-containing protein